MSETETAVKVETMSPVKTKLVFDVPWTDVKKEMDAVYREVNKKANIKGFRKGKIPFNILEKHYKDYVANETIANLIEKFYLDALKSHDIPAVNRPDIEQQGIETNKNFVFTATVEVEPDVEPKDYKDLELERIEGEASEEDVAAKLEEYRQIFAVMEDIKEVRGIREGDFVNIDFAGSIDGVRRKELEADNLLLEVGSKRFIPGFEEQLIGTANGETKEVNVRFPDDYYLKDVAGKDAAFSVTVKGIKEKVLPPLDDSFIKNFSKYQSLEELKEDIRQSLNKQMTMKSEVDLNNLIIKKLLEKNEIEVPPSYVEREYRYMMADAQRRMMLDGLKEEDASEVGNKFKDDYFQMAQRVVKIAILFKSIASKESIVVEESEIDERVEELARESRDYEKTRKLLNDEFSRSKIEHEMLHNKVLRFIKDNSQISVVKKNIDLIGEENR